MEGSLNINENKIDKLIDIDGLDPIKLLTPDDVLDHVQMYDSTV